MIAKNAELDDSQPIRLHLWNGLLYSEQKHLCWWDVPRHIFSNNLYLTPSFVWIFFCLDLQTHGSVCLYCGNTFGAFPLTKGTVPSPWTHAFPLQIKLVTHTQAARRQDWNWFTAFYWVKKCYNNRQTWKEVIVSYCPHPKKKKIKLITIEIQTNNLDVEKVSVWADDTFLWEYHKAYLKTQTRL